MRRVAPLALMLGLTGCYLSHERDTASDAALPDAPPSCAPMDVAALPDCTVGVPTYWWWDGHACQSEICPCHGADCGHVYRTEASCTAAHVRCR